MSSFKRKSPVPLRKNLIDDLDPKSSKLLHLPQSDLTRSTRPNLILMAMPPAKSKEESNSQVFQAMKEGKCSIVTNDQSTALVLPDSSYNLTTIGTSNTLVVYRPKKEEEMTDNNNTSENGNKKPKLDDRQPCRLIQPGGSGASFLSLTRNQIQPQDVEALLKIPSSSSSSNNEEKQKKQQQPCRHTVEELSLALQCSVPEVEQALESLPCAALPSLATPKKFRLWTDEEYWNAKRALVEMLCEEVDAEDEDLPPEQFAKLVAQRIVLPDDDNDDDLDASKWKLAMAQQMIRLGTTTTTCTKAAATSTTSGTTTTTPRRLLRRYWDKSKISKWALHDLILTSRQSTWPLEELLSTWQSRLPLLWCNDDDRIPAPKKQRLEEESQQPPVDDDSPMDGDHHDATNNTSKEDVATRKALEAMAEVEIFIAEGDDEKKDAGDTGDQEMVKLKF